MAKPEKTFSTSEVSLHMLAMAETQGLVSPAWREAWWLDEAALAVVLEQFAPTDTIRLHVVGGNDKWGSVWVAAHPMTGQPMFFSVCGAGAAEGVMCLTSPHAAATLRRKEPGRWVTWWDAFNALKKGARRGPGQRIGRDDWIGGVTSQGAVLGRAVSVRDGVPTQIQSNDVIFKPEEGVRWFKWEGQTRIKAVEALANNGETWFKSYVAMRATVVATARRMIKEGVLENDPGKPIVLDWRKKGRRGARTGAL